MIYLDTHTLIWLENGELNRFSGSVTSYLGNHELYISPMVKLELDYLYEIGRLNFDSNAIIASVRNKAELTICRKPWLTVVNKAKDLSFTRDPFDRLIVAHAMLDDTVLITKDSNLHDHYVNCVW